jgi:hypothetical protein
MEQKNVYILNRALILTTNGIMKKNIWGGEGRESFSLKSHEKLNVQLYVMFNHCIICIDNLDQLHVPNFIPHARTSNIHRIRDSVVSKPVWTWQQQEILLGLKTVHGHQQHCQSTLSIQAIYVQT